MRFRPSPGTVGVEYELVLTDAESGALADGAPTLLARVAGDPTIKPEFIESTIEVITPVCGDIAQVDRALRASLGRMAKACAAARVRPCGAGTHPTNRRLASVSRVPRYQAMAANSGFLGQILVTHALQVHVGLESSEQAIQVMEDLRAYLPLLLALSTSSPFWYGHDTGFASWRQRILAAAPTNGLPPRFPDWASVEALFEAERQAHIIWSWRDIHWDFRPRPDFGTIEIRVMDSVPSVTEACALAALARALVHYLIRTPLARRPSSLPRPLRWHLERANLFHASRCALDAAYVADDSGSEVRTLHEVARATFDAVAPVASELGDGSYFERLARLAADPSHARQRRAAQSGGPQAAIRQLAEELAADLGETPPPRARHAHP